MIEKFSVEDIMIKVLPGGFFLGVLYFVYFQDISYVLNDGLSFLYTFIFLCVSFIAGEVLQTFAHLLEKIVDVFFKFRRPSEVFLYNDNPVLKLNRKRDDLIDTLNLSEEDNNIFNISYKDLKPCFFRKEDKQANRISQSYFWKVYSKVSNSDEIKNSNRGYLFVRVIMIIFLISSVLFFIESFNNLGVIFALLFIVFFWRCRGYARGLVFKSVLIFLKESK